MNKLIKYLAYIFIAVITTLIFTGVVISVFYSSDIKKMVVENIQSKCESKIILSEVDFTLWNNFPYASVKISNLLVHENSSFQEDTLLFAKEAFLDISLLDIIMKEYNIHRISIENGDLNIKYENGNPNFLIFQSKNNNDNSKISINEIILINSNITYFDLMKNINWKITKALLKIKKSTISINSLLFSNHLIIGTTNYINDKTCTINGEITINNDTILIKKSSLLIENVLTNINGSIINNNLLNLNINAEKQEIENIINHMPDNFKKICAPFIVNGNFSCKANILGLVNKDNNPSFDMFFKISDGDFNLKSKPFKLTKINTEGKINNGNKNNFQTTIIEFINFNSQSQKNGFLKGNFNITNLNKYYLTAKLKSKWNLSTINNLYQDSPFFNLDGTINAVTDYKGRLSFNSDFKKHFITANHITNIKFTNTSFKYLNSNLNYNIIDGNCIINNNNLTINNSSLKISNSEFGYVGKIENFIPYILQKKKTITIKGNVNSSKILFHEIINNNNSKNDSKKRTFPQNIQVDLTTYFTKFIYNNFISNNLNGKIKYENQKLQGIDLIGNSLDGKILANFTLTEPTRNYLVLKTNVELENVNIRKSFKSFDNFKQNFISQEEINGIGTAEISLESHWKPNFIFDDRKLKIQSHLIIDEGELIDFKPLESLSSFVSLEDLKHVKFSKLENTIEVDNKIITIPLMEIKSSALSVFLSGTHSFDQKINYNIKLLLSEILSNTFRKKNTKNNTEFGEINEDGQVFTTVYLKMTGDTENPKISFDGLKIQEDIKKSISSEIEIINTIIKEDVLNKNKKDEEKEDDEEIIIEWEEEENYLPQ